MLCMLKGLGFPILSRFGVCRLWTWCTSHQYRASAWFVRNGWANPCSTPALASPWCRLMHRIYICIYTKLAPLFWPKIPKFMCISLNNCLDFIYSFDFVQIQENGAFGATWTKFGAIGRWNACLAARKQVANRLILGALFYIKEISNFGRLSLLFSARRRLFWERRDLF